MPENARVRKRKLLKLPTGDTVYIPVLSEISFVEAQTHYQEIRYSINNTVQASRSVHVDELHPTVDGEAGSGSLYVERIDKWNIKDPQTSYEDYQISFDNITGAQSHPPSFTGHYKRHVYRYYKDPDNPDDDGVWVDSELIDQYVTTTPQDQYQEHIHTLLNPETDDSAGQSSAELEDISDDNDGSAIDKPFRCDPFQNIINYSIGQDYIYGSWVFSISGNTVAISAPACSPVIYTLPGGSLPVSSYTSEINFTETPFLPIPSGAIITGQPSADALSFPMSDWSVSSFGITSGETAGTSASFDIWGQTITSVGVGCYGYAGAEYGGVAGGYVDGSTGTVATITIDATGVTASLGGITFDLLSCNIYSSGGATIRVDMIWKRP